ncbi:hypothetical protein N9J42_00025 [bacterium]|nr:hypothetical protein [bacterium]
MTELEFKVTNPSAYGTGNINLLYSSSVSTGSVRLPVAQYGSLASEDVTTTETGSNGNYGIYERIETVNVDINGVSRTSKIYYRYNSFFPPYKITGVTVPFSSANNVSLEATLKQIQALKFTVATEKVTVPIKTISRLNGYFYLQTEPLQISNIPASNDAQGTPADFNVEFTFLNYLADNFENNDFNVLQGNAFTVVTNKSAYQVDRNTDSANPSNLGSLVSETATLAEINYSNYTTTGWTNARYSGTKNNARIKRDNPAQTYINFEGTLHPLDSNNETILAAGQGDKDLNKLYFNVEELPRVSSGPIIIKGDRYSLGSVRTGPYYIPGSFPAARLLSTPDENGAQQTITSGSLIYREDGNQFIRVVSSKVHATDKGTVYTTDEFGVAIEETATGSSA